MSTERCRTCRFWLLDLKPGESDPGEDQDPGYGWCRREPPQIIDRMARMTIPTPGFGCWEKMRLHDPDEASSVINVSDATLYPATFGLGWCGRFEARLT